MIALTFGMKSQQTLKLMMQKTVLPVAILEIHGIDVSETWLSMLIIYRYTIECSQGQM